MRNNAAMKRQSRIQSQYGWRVFGQHITYQPSVVMVSRVLASGWRFLDFNMCLCPLHTQHRTFVAFFFEIRVCLLVLVCALVIGVNFFEFSAR